jgi:hypothetical protein
MTTHQLSAVDAERLRAFEREGHDALVTSYYEFFTPLPPWPPNPSSTLCICAPVSIAFERRAGVYKCARGLDLPVAFKVGSGGSRHQNSKQSRHFSKRGIS